MVEAIYEIKNKLLEQVEKDVQERGIDRLDKEKIDMIKDLAEAEKSCWEAEYYRSVTEAMDGSGYNQSGYSGSNSGNNSGGSRNYSGYRDSQGRYASRRGYGMGYQEHINALRMEMQNNPQERERIMQELRGMGVM